MNIEVVQYKSQQKKEWDSFVEIAKNATFLFKRDFMEYHSDRFEDASLMIYKNTKLVALFPANKSGDNEIVSHQGLTYGGLLFLEKEKFGAIKKYIQKIMIFMEDFGFDFVVWKLFPNIYNQTPSDEIEYVLFLLEANLIRRDIAIVVNSESGLKYSGNYRREAKKAEKEGAVIKKGDFETFWKKILIPNLKIKHGVKPVHSFIEINKLAQKFPENIVQYNVQINDEIVAGTTLFVTPTCVHCQYISANDLGRKSGALNYLFIHLLKDVYSEVRNFDFGIVNEKNGTYINEGLLFWKENMGGRSIKHDFYKIKTKNHISLG